MDLDLLFHGAWTIGNFSLCNKIDYLLFRKRVWISKFKRLSIKMVMLLLISLQELIQITAHCFAFMVRKLNWIIFENETHWSTTSSPHSFWSCWAVWIRLMEINPENILLCTLIDLNSVVRCKFTKKGNEITVTMPFDLKLHVWQTRHAVLTEELFRLRMILVFL
mgnify:CR=1 FL=1